MADRNWKEPFQLGQQAMLDTVAQQLRLIHTLKQPERDENDGDIFRPQVGPRRNAELEARVQDFLYDLTRSSIEAYRAWLDVNTRHFDTLADTVRASLGLTSALPDAIAMRATARVGEIAESGEVALRNPLPGPLRITFANPGFRSAGREGLHGGEHFTSVSYRIVRRGDPEAHEILPGQPVELLANEDLHVQMRIVAAASLGEGTFLGSARILGSGRALGNLSVTLEIRP